MKGLSAESIYDRIARDLRKYRKLATFAGVGQCDVLDPRTPEWWTMETGVTLDEFYRGCLSRGGAAESRSQLMEDSVALGNEFVHMLGHLRNLETRMDDELRRALPADAVLILKLAGH